MDEGAVAALAETTVLDRAGESVRLGSLWREHGGPTVLTWLRHYG